MTAENKEPGNYHPPILPPDRVERLPPFLHRGDQVFRLKPAHSGNIGDFAGEVAKSVRAILSHHKPS